MATSDDPDIETLEVASSELPSHTVTSQMFSSRDLILRAFEAGGSECTGIVPEKPVKFMMAMSEQSKPTKSIVLIRVDFPDVYPLLWYLFPSRDDLGEGHVFLRIPGMTTSLPTVKAVDGDDKKCLYSFLNSPRSDVSILIDRLTELFNFQPTDILFNDHSFSSWCDLLRCPFVYNADNLHIDNALDADVTMQILDQRVTLDKVTSFETFCLLDASMLTGTHLSFVRAESIQIGKHVMSPGEVLTEAQRHLSNKTGVTTSFMISVEGWTLENVTEFTKVLGLVEFDVDSNRNLKPPPISLNTCYKNDLWWMNPEDIPEGSRHWVCHFVKSTTGEFMRLHLDKWKQVEVRETVARRLEALPESSDESDSEEDEQEVVFEEDEYADENDENNDPGEYVVLYFAE